MDLSWLQNIISDESEKFKLQDWVKYNGADRLKRIYEIARGDSDRVSYYQMTECAKYDARVSQWLFKTIRIIEGHMRATLLNFTDWYNEVWDGGLIKTAIFDKFRFGIDSVKRENSIRAKVNQVLTRLSMAKKQEFTFPEFLDACSFSELKAIHSLLTEEYLYEGNIFKNRENIGEELYLVTILRNHISHNHIILDFYFIGKERRYALKQAVEIVLSYIEDTAMRARRIKELNGYAEYYRGAELMKIPEHYRILIEEK